MPSPGLQMIRDTIYSLKRDYGVKILVGNVSSTLDLGTGKKVVAYNTAIISKAILLPQNMMINYARLFNLAKMGIEEDDKRTILIDKRDLKNFPISAGSFLGYDSSGVVYKDLSQVDWDNLEVWNQTNNREVRRVGIIKTEDSLYALAISVNGLNAINIL